MTRLDPEIQALVDRAREFIWLGTAHDKELPMKLAMFAKQEMAALTTTAEPGEGEDWRDDPSADDRWNAGCQFAQDQLCKVLGVAPKLVNWDAATETLDGDVQSVTCKILTAGLGEEWAERSAPPSAQPSKELVERINRWINDVVPGQPRPEVTGLKLMREAATALSQPPETDAVAAERERLAKAIEVELLTLTLKDPGVRTGMALASSLVRRGRALTGREKLDNLKRALSEYDAEQSARSDAATGGES